MFDKFIHRVMLCSFILFALSVTCFAGVIGYLIVR